MGSSLSAPASPTPAPLNLPARRSSSPVIVPRDGRAGCVGDPVLSHASGETRRFDGGGGGMPDSLLGFLPGELRARLCAYLPHGYAVYAAREIAWFGSSGPNIARRADALGEHELHAYAIAERLFWLLDWARRNGFPWSHQTFSCAVQTGDTSVVAWLDVQGCPRDLERAACEAAAVDPATTSIALLEWLAARGARLTQDTFLCAVRAGRLDVVRWLRARGCAWPATAASAAATLGHLDVFAWAVADGAPTRGTECICALTSRGLDGLTCARSLGCAWDESLVLSAVVLGNLEALAWAVRNGCAWNKNRTLATAALCAYRRRKRPADAGAQSLVLGRAGDGGGVGVFAAMASQIPVSQDNYRSDSVMHWLICDEPTKWDFGETIAALRCYHAHHRDREVDLAAWHNVVAYLEALAREASAKPDRPLLHERTDQADVRA